MLSGATCCVIVRGYGYVATAFTLVALPVGRTLFPARASCPLMWKRGLHKEFPAFFCYAIFEAAGGGTIYAIDVNPAAFTDRIYWWSYFLLPNH